MIEHILAPGSSLKRKKKGILNNAERYRSMKLVGRKRQRNSDLGSMERPLGPGGGGVNFKKL